LKSGLILCSVSKSYILTIKVLTSLLTLLSLLGLCLTVQVSVNKPLSNCINSIGSSAWFGAGVTDFSATPRLLYASIWGLVLILLSAITLLKLTLHP
jgi:hypothetical protein